MEISAIAPPGGKLPRSSNLSILHADAVFSSVNSFDEDIVSEETDSVADAEKARLAGRIDQILDQKHSSTTSREETYAGYCRVLTSRYLGEDLNPHVTALVPIFLKSIKQESSEKEAVSALKGTPFARPLPAHQYSQDHH